MSKYRKLIWIYALCFLPSWDIPIDITDTLFCRLENLFAAISVDAFAWLFLPVLRSITIILEKFITSEFMQLSILLFTFEALWNSKF